MKKIYFIHTRKVNGTFFDYEKEFYEPLKNQSDFSFIFPHDAENKFIDSKELIGNCDLVLAEISFPSTGSGIEIGRAESLGIPVVAIFKKGCVPFSSIKFVTEDIIEYEDLEKDFDKIKNILNLRLK